MDKNGLPTTITETQDLIDELIEYAEKEKNKEKRRELLIMILEVKKHLIQLKQIKKESQ